MKPINHIQHLTILALLSHASPLMVPSAGAEILLRDEFNASAPSDNVNFEINASVRQTGTLAGLNYLQGAGYYSSTAGAGNDYQSQINNGANGKLWLVGNEWEWQNTSCVSPDHNFVENPGSAGFFSVSFTLNPDTGAASSGEWGGITLGASDNAQFGSAGTGARGAFINNPQPHFGMLFKDNGDYQAFDGSTGSVGTGNGAFALDPSGAMDAHHFEIRVTGLGDGNPWDGVGDALIEVFRDHAVAPFFTYTKTGGYTDNYITLEGFSGGFTVHEFDDLQVAIVPVTASEFKMISHMFDFDNDTLVLKWTSESGHLYKITTSRNLMDWSDLVTGITGDPGETTAVVDFIQETQGFFRVEEEQVPNP